MALDPDAEAKELYDYCERVRVTSGFTSTGNILPWDKSPEIVKELFRLMAKKNDPEGFKKAVDETGEACAQAFAGGDLRPGDPKSN